MPDVMQLQHTLKTYERIIGEKEDKIKSLSALLESERARYQKEIIGMTQKVTEAQNVRNLKLSSQVADMEEELLNHRTVCPGLHQQLKDLESKNTELRQQVSHHARTHVNVSQSVPPREESQC